MAPNLVDYSVNINPWHTTFCLFSSFIYFFQMFSWALPFELTQSFYFSRPPCVNMWFSWYPHISQHSTKAYKLQRLKKRFCITGIIHLWPFTNSCTWQKEECLPEKRNHAFEYMQICMYLNENVQWECWCLFS